MPDRVLEKLEYLVVALPLLDRGLKDLRKRHETEVMEARKGFTIDMDFRSLRQYLQPEIRLILGSSGESRTPEIVPLMVVIPREGTVFEVGDGKGLGAVQDLIAELRADDTPDWITAFDHLGREVDQRTTGNSKQKGHRLLSQLWQLLALDTA